MNLSDSLANINKNLEKIADGEQRLIKMANNEVENKGYGTAKENEN